MKQNEEMKEAKEKLEVMSEDEKMQILAELRLKAIRDEKAVERFGYNQGIEKGMEKGIEKGIKQGKKEERKRIAKRMKEQGINTQIIQNVTELTEEEINAL